MILAIISTLLEQGALVVIVLWGLPQLGIEIPTVGLVVVMVVWAALSVIMYQMGSRALRQEPTVGLPTMIGGQGKVVSPLAPEGMVRIRNELWTATSVSGSLERGERVTVIGQDGLRLIVRESHPADSGKTG